jgi:4'-phosphopantetheinyl transferase EntD
VPLFYQQDINEFTKLAVWKISEGEDFFLRTAFLPREITHPHKRLQHLAGRFLLAYLFPDFPYEEMLIADTRKPYLPEAQYHFSISHCGDYAAAIVSSRQRVGIDVEMVTARVDKIKHKFLHPQELAFVNSNPAKSHIELLTLLWSSKEAMFKWWGIGDIDFSESLRVDSFQFSSAGIIPARFLKDSWNIPLLIHFQLVNGLSLAWVCSE